jgi:hypothetical protein
MSDSIFIQCGSKMCVPTSNDVKRVAEKAIRIKGYWHTLRLLMSAGFCLLITTGCATRDELATLKQSLRTTETRCEENTTALAAIKASLEASEVPDSVNGKEVISVENEPQTDHDGNGSQTTNSQPETSAAVRLFVTHAPFNCPPCDAFDRAVARGDLAGFEIEPCGDFYGLKSYPAIRCDDASSPSGKKVLYGWSDSYAVWLRENLLPSTASSRKLFRDHQAATVVRNFRITHVNNTPPAPLLRTVTSSRNDVHPPGVMSHSEMKALHDQLHGGNFSWSWPGGTTESLAEHLRTTHGVQLAGIREQPVRLVNRGSACPDGRCPTSSRRGLFGWRR